MESRTGVDMLTKSIDEIDCIKSDMVKIRKSMVNYGLTASGSGVNKKIACLDDMDKLVKSNMERLSNMYSRFSAISEVLKHDADLIVQMRLAQNEEHMKC